MSAKIIALEGLDASFKETNSIKLVDELNNIGFNSYRFEFPNYENLSSYFVKEYLKGSYKNSGIDSNPLAKSIFYALDRFDTYNKNIRHIYENSDDNTIIIFDRYIASNMFYQLATIASDEALWSQEILRLFILEHDIYKLPIENGIIFLKTPVEVAQEIMRQQNRNKDYHESNIELQKLVYANADKVIEFLSSTITTNTILTTRKDNSIKDRDTLFNEVLNSALNIIGGN